MKPVLSPPRSIDEIWELARSGDLRGGAEAAHRMLDELGPGASPKGAVDLHLVAAHCAMRQGHHADALRELDAAEGAASVASGSPGLLLRIAVWRAELAYFQVGSSRVDLQACKLEYSIVSPK